MVWFIEAELQTLCLPNVVFSFSVREGGNGTKRAEGIYGGLIFFYVVKVGLFWMILTLDLGRRYEDEDSQK